MRALPQAGLKAVRPTSKAGLGKSTGYPDILIHDTGNRATYLECKIFAHGAAEVIAHPGRGNGWVSQGGAEGVEDGGSVGLCGADDGAEGGVGFGAPFAAEAVGDFAKDHAGAKVAFGHVVGCALPRCTILPGGNPGRQTLAPAGSTRGGSGGDEWSEALREKGPVGGQRTVRAAT